MSVDLSPANQLSFPRPLTQLVKRTLTIRNPSAEPVAFKVKTTAPRQYCVRPNAGRIEAGESVEVSVLLQAMKEEPPLSAKCKDKFLVQSATIPPEKEIMSLAEVWSSIENAGRVGIQEQKIRCVYTLSESEDGLGLAADTSKTIQEDDEAKDAPTSPAAAPTAFHAADTTIADRSMNTETSSPIASTPATPSPAPVVSREPPISAEPTLAASSAVEKPVEAVGLRKRTTAGDASAATETAVKVAPVDVVAAASGVPIQVVAAIALAVFVLTYLFF